MFCERRLLSWAAFAQVDGRSESAAELCRLERRTSGAVCVQLGRSGGLQSGAERLGGATWPVCGQVGQEGRLAGRATFTTKDKRKHKHKLKRIRLRKRLLL